MLVWDLALTATDGRDHALDVFAYCEFSQMIWQDETTYGYYTKLQLKTFYDARSASVNHRRNWTIGSGSVSAMSRSALA